MIPKVSFDVDQNYDFDFKIRGLVGLLSVSISKLPVRLQLGIAVNQCSENMLSLSGSEFGLNPQDSHSFAEGERLLGLSHCEQLILMLIKCCDFEVQDSLLDSCSRGLVSLLSVYQSAHPNLPVRRCRQLGIAVYLCSENVLPFSGSEFGLNPAGQPYFRRVVQLLGKIS